MDNRFAVSIRVGEAMLNNHESTTYVFWIIDSWKMPRLFSSKQYLLNCKISDRLELGEHLTMQLIDIDDVSRTTGGYKTNLHIEVLIKSGQKEISLVPTNPLTPNNVHSNHGEVQALLSVIKSLKSGMQPEVLANPYHRELIRQKREQEISERDWDPYESPYTYYAIDHPPTSIRRRILLTLLTIFVLLVLLIVVGIVFGGIEIVI
ncbi:MAG: hypothetical protein GY746_01670 [Gammaproteobacteria bacterium]|nr:hypothetical protein [Gammaproteobacteria bacterium]